PVFGGFLPIATVPVHDTAISAIPMIDVVDCFDVSGSMDDETNVTFVKRVWIPSSKSLMGMNDYQPVYTASGAVAEGPIQKILKDPPRGINLNGLPPQGLEEANNAPAPLKFSEVTSSQTVGLRGVTETGSRPGNALPPMGATPTPSVGGKDVFTDVVVNLDGNAHFAGFSKDGFNFPNIAVLVEAARGNLDDPVSFANAGLAGDSRFAGIVPRFGYKHAYEGYAQQKLEPLNTSRIAALNFSYNLLHTNTCRLGEVSFHDTVGAPGISTFSAPKVSAAYPPGGTGAYLLPNMYEQPIDDTLFAIYKTMCTSSTDPAARNWGATNNAGAAITAAIGWLSNPAYHRPNADRAIVLFTNSAPSNSEMPATRAAAKRAADIGIPIYVVGLADNQATQSIQMAAFTDSNNNPSSGGICGIAGHGSRFFQVSNVTDIPQAFGNVGRHLVKLTTSN
ncbi:MAG TPA: VWA domain-containing protein, partial [Chroococcales cyanobacterium]